MKDDRLHSIRHEFVETMPRPLEDGILYLSIKHRIALHRCFCGCGFEVATPLAPHEWQLYFDGETVSLTPSVGVWGLECQSHYWIKGDRVLWERRISKDKIERLRRREESEVERSAGRRDIAEMDPPEVDVGLIGKLRRRVWRRQSPRD